MLPSASAVIHVNLKLEAVLRDEDVCASSTYLSQSVLYM